MVLPVVHVSVVLMGCFVLAELLGIAAMSDPAVQRSVAAVIGVAASGFTVGWSARWVACWWRSEDS